MTDNPSKPTPRGKGRVPVAGATGYLGSRMARRLKEDGYWVRALVRRPEQAAGLSAVDEIFVAQVTAPASLVGICDGVDILHSSIGITRQRDGVGCRKVDYGGNLALLGEAERAGVEPFVYVSVLHGPGLRGRVRLAAAKEEFVDELLASPVASTIIRPTAYFSDMEAFLDMARKGVAFVIGNGHRRMNPISGEDLAVACIEAAEAGIAELGWADRTSLPTTTLSASPSRLQERNPGSCESPHGQQPVLVRPWRTPRRNESTALPSSSCRS